MQEGEISVLSIQKFGKLTLGKYCCLNILCLLRMSFSLHLLQGWCQLWPEEEGRRLLLHWNASEGGGTIWAHRDRCQPAFGLLPHYHPADSIQARDSRSGSSHPFGASLGEQCPQPVCTQFFLAYPGWPCIPGGYRELLVVVVGGCISWDPAATQCTWILVKISILSSLHLFPSGNGQFYSWYSLIF